MIWIKTLYNKPSTLKEFYVQRADKKFAAMKSHLEKILSLCEFTIEELQIEMEKIQKSMEEIHPQIKKASLVIFEKQLHYLQLKISTMYLFEFTINFWAAGLFFNVTLEKILWTGMVSLIPATGFAYCLKSIFEFDVIMQKSTRYAMAIISGLITFLGFWFLAEFLSARAELFAMLLANKGVGGNILSEGFRVASAAIGIALAAAIGVYLFDLQLRRRVIKVWKKFFRDEKKLKDKIKRYEKIHIETESKIQYVEKMRQNYIQNKINKIQRWREFWKKIKLKVPEEQMTNTPTDEQENLFEILKHMKNGKRKLLPVVTNTMLLLFISFCFISTLNGCKDINLNSDKKNIRYIVGLDISISNVSTIERTPSILRKLVDFLNEKDNMLIQVIDSRSETQAQTLVNHTMSEDFGPSDLFAQTERDKLIAQILSIDTLLVRRNSLRGRTDILGYLRELSSQLDTAKYFERIILLTDGINSTSELNMYVEKDLMRALRRLSIPDLKGIKIYFVGPTEDGNRITVLRYNQIKQFWQEYFKRANAKLIAYSFDPEFTFTMLRNQN